MLAFAIIAALFWYDIIDGRVLLRVLSDPEASIPGFFMLVVAFVLAGARWAMILRAFGVALSFRRVFEIFAIGVFSNSFLPGGTGGDVLRVVYIVRSVREGRLRGAVSVLADRVIGLYGVLTVAMVLIAANSEAVYGHVATKVLASGLIGIFAGITLVGGGLVLAARPLHASRLVSSWEGRSRVYRFARRLVTLLVIFRGMLPTVVASIVLSVIVTLLNVGCVVVFALAHGREWLGAIAYASAAVFSLLANAIPLTPGGIGVAEGAFAYLCILWAGAGTGAAFGTIFLSYRLMVLVVSLFGAIAFVTHRRDH